MDKLEKYQQAVRQLLTQCTEDQSSGEEIQTQLVFDDERGHYQWMEIGWDEFTRIYNCLVHFDIQKNKVWLQRNMTERDLAEDLVELGVERKDIILGLHPPYKRPYTDYGVA